jgi:hypothetical protein
MHDGFDPAGLEVTFELGTPVAPGRGADSNDEKMIDVSAVLFRQNEH